MIALLVILFIMKLYARNITFKYVKKKNGEGVIKMIRYYQSLETKYMKVKADKKFFKSYKKKKILYQRLTRLI